MPNQQNPSGRRVCDTERKGTSKRNVPFQNERKPGAPKGNRNAADNRSSTKFQPGNTASLKHGGYAEIHLDTLGDEERALIESLSLDLETLLLDEIGLYIVRSRRLLIMSREVLNREAAQVLVSTVRHEKHNASGDGFPGEPYNLTTSTESNTKAYVRIEQELTRLQRATLETVETLHYIREDKGTEGVPLLDSGGDILIYVPGSC